MEHDVYDFGLRLKTLREKLNFTQSAVADRLGVTVGTVKKYENNTLLPPVDKLETMALMFNTSLDYLRNLDNRHRIYIDDLSTAQQEFIVEMIDRLKEALSKYDSKK